MIGNVCDLPPSPEGDQPGRLLPQAFTRAAGGARVHAACLEPGEEGPRSCAVHAVTAPSLLVVHELGWGGQYAPNEAAIFRLVGAILLEQNDEWAVQRLRYMMLETIAPLSDNSIVRVPAVAN